MPRLHVLAGPTPTSLTPITANTSISHTISSSAFEGRVLVYIKGLTDPQGNVLDSEYFEREDRKGITWSIQVQGRFLQPRSADDVLFGNTFDRPLKLPWGSGAALKFMHFIDPTLEHDLASPATPWALSPLVATMPHFAHVRLSDANANDQNHWPEFPPKTSLTDDNSQLYLTYSSPSPSSSSSLSSSNSHSSPSSTSAVSSSPPSSYASASHPEAYCSASSLQSTFSRSDEKHETTEEHLMDRNPADDYKKVKKQKKKKKKQMKRRDPDCLSSLLRELTSAHKRRAYFKHADHRRQVVFGPNPRPQAARRIAFELMHYWDGQPVRFVCCERRHEGEDGDEGGVAWGRVFWCVSIELADSEDAEVEGAPHQQPSDSHSDDVD
ncbi:hypothetical protein EW146_g8658 [Bondarzewia mesenterica]|uniref:Domain of unknown function at the cortex 1 domain-containing protein n=1 Tax=Bondarzewia mesenterica TaxID=1095465 RepID=A0A4S4LD63_9AGAM|nr:hypothetical protein EW146_g8658 [Bondarzewia mesenterica]